jgi:DNA polymerase III sliding clamp (beta) subunit (PCNA family)
MTEKEITRRTLAPLHCASNDETRYNLRSLHFDTDGSTVATDGHLMARAVPVVPNNDPAEPFTLAAEALADLNREQRKKKAEPARMEFGERNVIVDGVDEIPHLDGDFPDWRQCHEPPKSVHHEVAISLHNLERMVAAARQFTNTRKGEVVQVLFRFPKSDLKAIRAEVTDKESLDRLEFTVMPCRR